MYFHDQLVNASKNAPQVKYSPFVYAKILEILKSGEEQLQRGLSIKSNLEALLFKAIECTKVSSIEVLLQALNSLPDEVKKNDF